MAQPLHERDATLKAAVGQELRWTPSIDSTKIGVSVSDGTVTLSGEVASYPEKLLAGRAAQRVHGVVAIAQEITVSEKSREIEDSDLHFQRDAAGYCVEYLKGVVGVRNLIIVRPTMRAGNLKVAIRAALVRHAQVDSRTISVTTTPAGEVTLSGTVRTWAEREQAENACWAAPGITAVHNDLHLVPRSEPAAPAARSEHQPDR